MINFRFFQRKPKSLRARFLTPKEIQLIGVIEDLRLRRKPLNQHHVDFISHVLDRVDDNTRNIAVEINSMGNVHFQQKKLFLYSFFYAIAVKLYSVGTAFSIGLT